LNDAADVSADQRAGNDAITLARQFDRSVTMSDDETLPWW
jgi:hypothetical protein